MRAKNVLEILQVHRVTLNKYVREGKIHVIKMSNGRYEYNDEDVYAFVGKKKRNHGSKIVSYSRVSTQAQKNQLKEQTLRIYNSCIARNIILDEQLEEIGSGMSSDRKAFDSLCQKVFREEISLVVVENKDRLIRFGFDLLERFFNYFGTKILVLNDSLDNRTYEQELTEDLISVIHYFTMKSYSHRRRLNKLRKELEDETKSNNSKD